MCVLPYKYRKILEMLLKLIKLCGQVPIFSSINTWNGAASQGSCPRNERQVTDEMAGLAYGRLISNDLTWVVRSMFCMGLNI